MKDLNITAKSVYDSKYSGYAEDDHSIVDYLDRIAELNIN